MSNAACIFSGNNCTVYYNGVMYTFNQEHFNYASLKEAVRNEDYDKFVELYNENNPISHAINNTTIEGVTYVDGVVYVNGEAVHNSLTERINSLASEGYSFDSLIKFLENLNQNPSANSVEQLYLFLERKNLPITDDGCFLAYKSVRDDYKDKYSGTIDNSIGKIVKIERNKVDDNKEKHCSYGLHVGALDYSGPGGWYNNSSDKVVVVKVNPKDAVSVPTDHSYTKLRVCEYEDIADYVAPLSNSVYSSTGDEYKPCVDTCIDYLDVDTLMIDDEISFEYTKLNGDVSSYHITVDEIDMENNLILGRTKDGGFRRFHMDNMEKIVLVDIDETIDDDYDNDEYN